MNYKINKKTIINIINIIKKNSSNKKNIALII